jgi:hypothetical protein
MRYTITETYTPAEETRVSEVRRMFQKLYPNATPNEVTTFYIWLEENGPDLLPPGNNGDSYQELKSELEGLWGNKAPHLAKKKRKSELP